MADHGTCPFCHETMNGDPVPGLTGRYLDVRIPIVPAGEQQVLLWRCPYCGFRWARYGSGPLADRAAIILAAEVVQEAHDARIRESGRPPGR